MAPACILLDRTVAFRSHPQETQPFGLGVKIAKGVVGVGATAAELATLPSHEATEASTAEYLLAMTPDDLEFVDPPEISRLTMHRPLSSELMTIQDHGWSLRDGAVAAAADKNLVVLHTGCYRRAYSYNRWYLILDLDADDASSSSSSSSSLSAIPGIRIDYYQRYRTAGHGVVISTREGGAGGFVLAELLLDFHHRSAELPGLGLLCLWQSPSASVRSWVYKHGELPAQVPRTWRTHMSFPVQTSSSSRNLFCWVDLLHGLLLCDLQLLDLLSDGLLHLSFVPLPHGCSSRDHQHPRWSSNPQEYRNMACVDGTIKFLNMDGFVEGGPISLVTYALDLMDNKPSPSWMLDTKLLLTDLWKDRAFVSKDVAQMEPLFPILSTVEHDVVYLVTRGDLEHGEGYPFRGVKFLLSVDTRRARVISAAQQKNPTALVGWSYTLAATVSLSHQLGSKRHQGAVEAMGRDGGKRKKAEV